MNKVKSTLSLSKDAIEIARKTEVGHENTRHTSNYYRLKVDNNSSFFSTELPSHVSNYQNSDVHGNIISIEEEFDSLDYELLREIIHQYRDWAYLYGFKSKDNSTDEVNVSIYGNKETEELIGEMNRRVRSGNVKPQDVFLSLRLCYIAFREVESERFDTTEDFVSVIEKVSEQVENLIINRKENTNIPYEWNAVGASLDYTETQLLRKA